MRNQWYKHLYDIISKYGIKEEPYGYSAKSYFYKGVWIFDRYCTDDFAFRSYDTKTHEFGEIERCHQYSYISFTRALDATIRHVNEFLIHEKYRRIREDFE
jgi:hypothetical protein